MFNPFYALQTKAQVFVPPTLNDQLLTSPVTGSIDDITINCDMLMHMQGANPIKAIAWDEGSRSNRGHLYFEDPNGNQVFLQFNGVHPDIVLGDDKRAPGVNYRAAVVYITPGSRVMVDFYDLRNIGTPGFAAYYASSATLTPTNLGPIYDTRPIPHIDMWSDVTNPVNGYPGMYEFAATWEEGSDIYYNWGHISSGTLYNPNFNGAKVNTSQSQSRNFTDVACYTKNQQRFAAFSYKEWTSPTTALIRVTTLNLSTSPVVATTVNFGAFPNTTFPRIEALSQYNGGYLAAEWEVVVSHPNSCWVYNVGGMPANISSPLLPNGNFKSTAIAAGIGPMGAGIGNSQYTAGYIEWTNVLGVPNYYARAVDATTGSVLDPNYYLINSGTVFGMPQYFEVDASKSLALSSTSNSGDYLLSVWYDGANNGNIWYKLSGNGTPMQFKTTAVSHLDGSAPVRLYPNPARDELFAENAAGDFKVYNLAGMTVTEGHLSLGESIDIKTLSAGTYLLQIGGKMHKFTKQ